MRAPAVQEFMPKVIITIPCFNESNRLPVAEIVEELSANGDMGLCFVDDGSRDNTMEVLESIRKQFPDRVLVVSLGQNRGKAEAVRTGILRSIETFNPELVGFLDADLATPFEEIERLLESAERFRHVVMFSGCRVRRLGAYIDRLWWRHYLGRVFATAASISLGLPVYDTQCGAKIFRAEEAAGLFERPFSSRWIFDVEIFARVAKRWGAKQATERIMEVPLQTWKDRQGSKVRLTSFVTAFFDLLKIHREYHRNDRSHREAHPCRR